jgi:hypothetical protein
MENGGTWSKMHLKKGPLKVACGNQAAQLATHILSDVNCARCLVSKTYKVRKKMSSPQEEPKP